MAYRVRGMCLCILLSFSLYAQKEITDSLPWFGKITMSQKEEGVYTGKVDDRSIGPLKLSNGTAKKEEKKLEVTYKDAELAGKKFQVTFSKEPSALSSGMQGQTDIVGLIEGEEGRTINIAGVQLEQAQVLINIGAREFIIEGIIKEFGLEFIGRFTGSQGEKKLIFDASVQKTPEKYYPFREISTDAPDFLKDIQLKRIQAGIRAGAQFSQEEEGEKGQGQGAEVSQEQAQSSEKKDNPLFGRLYIEGDVEGLPLTDRKVKGLIEVGLRGGTPQGTMLISLPEGWKLSNMFNMLPFSVPGVFKEAVNAINIEEARFLATTQESFEYKRTSYDRGLNAYAMLTLPEKGKNKFTDILRGIYNELGLDPEDVSLELFGNFNPFGKEFELESVTELSGLNMSIAGFDFQNVGLGITIAGQPEKAEFELVGECELQPPKQEEPLTFNIGLAFETPSQVGPYVSMEGMWNDPLGIKGISVGNLGLKASLSIGQAIATGGLAGLLPSQAGLTGDADIQFTEDKTTKADFSLKGGTNPSEWAFEASIEDAPNFPEFTSFLVRQLDQDVNIPTENIFPVQVNKAMLKFVPFPTKIGEIKVDQGIGGELDIELFGKRGKLYAAANIFKDLGVTFKGSLDPVHLKGLHITGAGDSDKPRFDYQLNAKNQHAILKGNLYLGPKDKPIIQSESDVEFSREKASFAFDSKLGPFNACIAGGIRDLKSSEPDAEITIDLQNDFFEEITGFINKAKDKVTGWINDLKNALSGKEEKTKKQKQKIQEKEKRLNELREKAVREAAEAVKRKAPEVVKRHAPEPIDRGGGRSGRNVRRRVQR